MACHGVFCKLYHSLMIFHCLTPRAVRQVGVIRERTSDFNVIYRTLRGKPILVNYPFYPIDCFWFLNSKLQCQKFTIFPLPLHWYFRISTKQNQTFMTISRSNPFSAVILGNLYLGISFIWSPVYWMISSCPCVHFGVMVTEDLNSFVFLFRCFSLFESQY